MLGIGLAVGLTVGGLSAWRSGSGASHSFLPDGFIRKVEADVGRGEYAFLPCRKEMWVINRVNGRIVHYVAYDTEDGRVDHSRIGEVDLERFPMKDTEFVLSDRNLNSYLWACNKATGDFQLWRASKDGILTYDKLPVPAGEHLREAPVQAPPRERVGREADYPPRRRPPVSAPAEPAPPAPDRGARKKTPEGANE